MKWISYALVCLCFGLVPCIAIAADKPSSPPYTHQKDLDTFRAMFAKHGIPSDRDNFSKEEQKKIAKLLPEWRQLAQKGNFAAVTKLAGYIRDSNRTKAGLQEVIALLDQAANLPTVTAAEKANIAEEKENIQLMLDILFGAHQQELAAFYAMFAKHGLPVDGGERPKLSKKEGEQAITKLMPDWKKLVESGNFIATAALAQHIHHTNPTKKGLQEAIMWYDRAEAMKTATASSKRTVQERRAEARQQLAALAKPPATMSKPKKASKTK